MALPFINMLDWKLLLMKEGKEIIYFSVDVVISFDLITLYSTGNILVGPTVVSTNMFALNLG